MYLERAATQGTRLLSLHATDADGSPAFSTITYSVSRQQSCGALFTVTAQTGILQATRFLDYENGPITCDLTVQATDIGGLSNTTMLHINIQDANEFRPIIPSNAGRVDVRAPQGTSVGETAYTFQAVDYDRGPVFGSVVNFSISQTVNVPFRVTPRGELIVTQLLTRGDLFTFELYATDGGGLESGPVTVLVNITESNDHPPEITSPLNTVVHIYENVIPSRAIHTVEAMGCRWK